MKHNFTHILKHSLLSVVVLFPLLFSGNKVFAQVAKATWAGTANGNVVVIGNITANTHTFSAGLNSMLYDATYGARATNFGGTSNTTAVTPTYTKYFEYIINTASCYDFTVTSITFTNRCSWDPRGWELHYSINGGPETQIGGDIMMLNRNTSSNYNSGALSIAVPAGSFIRFRLYGGGSTFSTFGSKNFVVNGTTTLLPTSPSVAITANPSATICAGTSVTFNATPVNGGTSPSYQWKLNGVNVGTNSPSYVNAGLIANDQVSCVMTSSSTCAIPSTATSNSIVINIISTPATPGAITGLAVVDASIPGLVYSITAVPTASSYTWTVPTGWVITAGQGTTSITVTSGIIGQTGNITVVAVNACGAGAGSSKAVSITLPHNSCAGCHINHTAPGGTITNVAGNANLCMSCHNPAGLASTLPFDNLDKAIPGTSGTSHAWDKTSVNAAVDASRTTNTEMLLRLPGDKIICSTCHNQHTSAGPGFLRANNTGDTMCKDCHNARDRGRFVDDNVNNRGTHPVGLVYTPGVDGLRTTPLAPFILPNNKVECSSCHKMHFAGSTDGNLLRATNDQNLCKSCHNYGMHKGMVCADCHTSHNTDKTNIYLVNSVIGGSPVIFSAETGTNSFGDATGAVDGVCQVCHTPSSFVLYHRKDGTNLNHNAGTSCVTCHPHSANFYPQTDCMSCHSSVMGPRRKIVTSVNGDFVEPNHHMGGNVTVSDCVKCHYMGEHRNGVVKLLDPDQGDNIIYTYDPLNKGLVENFCLNCHDSDGYNGNMTPFSGGATVPQINQTKWTNSSHKSIGSYTCLDCHDNGHGSNKSKLLGPSNYAGDASPDPWNDQEEFCENCHKAGGVASSDIESEFNMSHSHQVDETTQFGTNSGLECLSCHNPHYNKSTAKTSDPDNTELLWTRAPNSDRDFCLKCHDGSPPAGISFPATSYGTGYDKSDYVGARHDQVINIGETNYVGIVDDCRACHQHHGASGVSSTSKTGIYTMIKGKYDKSGSSGSNTMNNWDNNDNGDYQLCWDCHQRTMIAKTSTYSPNSFDTRHEKHVDGVRTPCILCHDVHKSYDASEPGQIDFTYGNSSLANNDVNLLGHTLSSAFYISGSKGYCYLSCHATWGSQKNHTPKNYNRFPLTYPWTYSWPK